MATMTMPRLKKPSAAPTVVDAYDIAADAKKRISLRKAGAKYFHVVALSNGSYILQPRALVPLKLRIDKVEAVQPPKGIRPLMRQIGQALDRLPAG
jgi:hypothetical protein